MNLSWCLEDSGFVLISTLDLLHDFVQVTAFFLFLSGSGTACHFVFIQQLAWKALAVAMISGYHYNTNNVLIPVKQGAQRKYFCYLVKSFHIVMSENFMRTIHEAQDIFILTPKTYSNMFLTKLQKSIRQLLEYFPLLSLKILNFHCLFSISHRKYWLLYLTL